MQGGVCIVLLFGWLWLVDGLVRSSNRITVVKNEAALNKDKVFFPGDYVTHEKYGTGIYRGLATLKIAPKVQSSTSLPVLVVQYSDSELLLSVKQALESLYLHHRPIVEETVDEQIIQIDSACDTKRWQRLKEKSLNTNKKKAVNLLQQQRQRQKTYRPPAISDNDDYERFEQEFAFTPTADQVKCFKDIANDMVNVTKPMDRLICGDVGFGKTEVGFRALYRAILSGRQVAFLAPTRLLAMQHLRSLQGRFPQLVIRCLHTGVPSKLMRQYKAEILSGTCQVIVGTQSVLSTSLKYFNLGLLIIDEEQRFGVENKQRMQGLQLGLDVLTLSATPIPRTLRKATENIIDISVLETPPASRKPVTVEVIPGVAPETVVPSSSILSSSSSDPPLPPERDWIDYDRLAEVLQAELDRGGQAFVVVPYISGMERVVARIQAKVSNATVIDIHGQMHDIEERAEKFMNRQANILVATTVVENGINIPSVNTIAILSAEKFGLATLYQLKGRVGRGSENAFAYFLFNTTRELRDVAAARIDAIQQNTALGSGRRIADADSRIRGAGSLFGMEQSGKMDWVGSELESKYLELQMSRLTAQVIMPASESVIQLNDNLEKFAWMRGIFLPPVDNSDVREETSVRGGSYSTVAVYENAIVNEVLKKLVERGALTTAQQDRLSALLTRGLSQEQCDVVAREIQGIYKEKVPPVFNNLLSRLQLRLLCRQSGVTFLRRLEEASTTVQIVVSHCDQSKFAKIQRLLSKTNCPSFQVRFINDGRDAAISLRLHTHGELSMNSELDQLLFFMRIFSNAVDQLFASTIKESEESVDPLDEKVTELQAVASRRRSQPK